MTHAKPYILLAEDDLEDQEMIRDLLQTKFPEIDLISVANGRELIQYLASCEQDHLPALILIDYHMPLMSAPEVLTLLQQNPQLTLTARIVWSNSNHPDHVDTCIQLGAANYFLKPHTSAQLDNMMSWIMNSIGFQQRLFQSAVG